MWGWKNIGIKGEKLILSSLVPENVEIFQTQLNRPHI